jgi:hypothetical protein
MSKNQENETTQTTAETAKLAAMAEFSKLVNDAARAAGIQEGSSEYKTLIAVAAVNSTTIQYNNTATQENIKAALNDLGLWEGRKFYAKQIGANLVANVIFGGIIVGAVALISRKDKTGSNPFADTSVVEATKRSTNLKTA